MNFDDYVRPGFDFDIPDIDWNGIESIEDLEQLLIDEFDFEVVMYEG